VRRQDLHQFVKLFQFEEALPRRQDLSPPQPFYSETNLDFAPMSVCDRVGLTSLMKAFYCCCDMAKGSVTFTMQPRRS
jgi:hypothetical protein